MEAFPEIFTLEPAQTHCEGGYQRLPFWSYIKAESSKMLASPFQISLSSPLIDDECFCYKYSYRFSASLSNVMGLSPAKHSEFTTVAWVIDNGRAALVSF